MADRIGEQLGNYRLIRLLGEGGFAEVYLGEHIYLGISAAIKVLHVRVAQEDMGNFLTEARTVANLVHPHIVRVLEFGLEANKPFLVMDYAPNGNLRHRHSRGTRLSPQEILPYLKQVADALQYAHEEKLIHRDVKPENMLINKRDVILLSDFGIALETKSSRYQSTQDVVGTVAYMAPEQIQGKPRRSSDQYALGVVVYEWLTGAHPFRGTFTEVATQHILAPPPSLREKVPTLSTDIEQVVLTALSKDPQQRFGSVLAFARAFEQACQEPVIYIPPPFHPKEELPPTQYAIIPPQSEILLPPTQLATPPSSTPQPAINTPPPTELATPPSVVTPYTEDKIVDKPLYSYRMHSGRINTVAWSPDGTRIASAGRDQIIRVWEVTTGRNLVLFNLHQGEVSAVAWSPDGTRIASAGKDRTVQIWEVIPSDSVVIYRNHKDWVRCVAWSPDGTRIASGGEDRQVHIWDAATGHQSLFYFALHKARVNTAAWSPDGTHVASGGDDWTVQVWETVRGGKVVTCSKHVNRVNSVAWSPDGTRIVSGSGDHTARIWEATTGGNFLFFGRHTGEVNVVAWSPDGTNIASGGKDRTIRIWEPVVNGAVIRYQGFPDSVTALAWSPDGTQIAAASADGTVQIWRHSQ